MEKDSWEGGVRRRLPAYDSGAESGHSPAGYMHQPGKPIGFLAAQRTPYAKKIFSSKLMILTFVLLPIFAIVNLALICVPILWGVANHTIAVSVMHIYESNITRPTDDHFYLTMLGQVKKAGVFPAHLYFREPVEVMWMTPPDENGNGMEEKILGHFPLDRIGIAAGHGRINQYTRFNISDLPAFTKFTEFMITQPEFTWRLRCHSVHIEAFGFLPTFKNLKMVKDVVFKGMNNMQDVKILDFKLPGADPAGGITYQAFTGMNNPSPFGIQLGDLSLDLYYEDVYLGPGTSYGVNMTSGENYVTLSGHLVPHTNNTDELNKLGVLMTRYINGEATPTIAKGREVKMIGQDTPSWLSAGIKALTIQVPFQSPIPINPIKSIIIKQFNLTYPPGGDPYSPTASSDSLSAEMGLPFGFPLTVISTKNEITIVNEADMKPVATVNGVMSNAETELNIVSAGQMEATLYLTLRPSPMTLPYQSDDARREFEMFQKEFTFSKQVPKLFNGTSSALTDTPVGRILLDGIRFTVESGLLGLQGLTQYPTLILGVDVMGGTQEALTLNVNTSIYNPSNVNLDVGNVTLLMVNHDVVGDALIPNMKLAIGNNTLSTISHFNPKASPYGYETINRYVSGLDTPLNISGFEGSTPIDSLVPAFSAVRVNTTLPGLQTQLVQSASLEVLPTTGIKDDVAHAVVGLSNPFTADIRISHIVTNVTAFGLYVASVDTDLDFLSKGKAVSQSPAVDLHMNLYPPDMFALVRAYAAQAGLNLAPLDGIVQEVGGYTYSPTIGQTAKITRRSFLEEPMVETHMLERRKTNKYTGFNIADFVDKAFANATSDLSIMSTTHIGDYTSDMTFVQTNVPLKVDQTLHLLLPVLAKPIVQKIVDGSILEVSRVTIINPQPMSFTTQLQGAIRNSGPFDAVIKFPNGLQLTWNNKVLGQISMPDIPVVAEEGATLNVQADFAVKDVDALTEFTKFMVLQPSFVWNIAGENLTVSALGIDTGGISISKTVILTGMNQLKNDVTVLDYDLPYNDPAGGIHLTAQSKIVNPAQVGVQLSRFGVSVWRNGTNLGPSAAAQPFTMNALAETNLPLAGRLQYQAGGHGLDVLSQTFTDVTHGLEIPVEIHGEYAGPPDVKWLNEGIKVLNIKTKLPAKHFNVIKSIDISQMTLMFDKQHEWAPLSSSNNTQAPFYLPFAFPLDIREAGGLFKERFQNKDVASLNVPYSHAVTDVQARIMTLEFSNVRMQAYGGAHNGFSNFLATTTRDACVKFGLHGSANAKANTAAGYVTISDIPFDVQTSLLGLQNLNARPATVSDLDVFHGYKNYLLIKVNAHMWNPSHLTVGTGDVSFGLNFRDHSIGSANIKGLVIHPGENVVPTDVHYSPQGSENKATGQVMLENYVQGIPSTTIIQGSRSTTDIASLKEALAGISLSTVIPPLHQLLIIEARLVIPKNIAQTSTAEASFQLRNPFTASINLVKLNADASYEGIFLGNINQDLGKNPISAPGHTTITSRTLPIKMDLRPKHLINFIEAAAAATGTDLGPLKPQFDKVMAMSNTDTTVKPYPDDNPPPCHSGHQFDVFGAVFSLLRGLKVKLQAKTTTKLDDYETGLNIVQEPVPADTDRTALYLIGPVGAPIVQNIVDDATLAFQTVNVTNVRDDGFDLHMQGHLLNAGPFDAQIEFPEGVIVTWEGKQIAKIDLPPVCSFADVGVPNYITPGKLKITDQKGFTEYTKAILHEKSFKWTIHTDKLRVRSLNIIFDNVKISKDLYFDAFNGLPGVSITSFDIPGETSNSLKIVSGSDIPSPASLGMNLETANFKIYYKNLYIGPAGATNLFMAAHSVTHTTLHGFITEKKGDRATNITGDMFSRYLQGLNTTLQIRGDNVVTKENGNKPVKWLSDAFKTLTLNVVLPGRIFQIVHSITIIDLFVTMMKSEDTWAPPISSNQTLATYANPFRFSLKPLKTGMDAYMNYKGADAAHLKVPLLKDSAGTSHGPTDKQPLTVSFYNYRLTAVNRDSFTALFSDLVNMAHVTFGLHGAANLIGQMVIGNIPINGIPFNVSTNQPGFNNFGGSAKVERVDAKSATKDYADNSIILNMNNPSNITIHTYGMALPSFYKDVYTGRALLGEQTLIPGQNHLQAVFRYQPNNPNDTVAQQLIQQYVQPVPYQGTKTEPINTPVVIKGIPNAKPPMSPFAPLIPGLEKLVVNSVLPGLGVRELVRIDNFIDLLTSFSGPGGRPFITIQLTFKNDMPIDLEVLDILDEARQTPSTESSPVMAAFHEQNIKGCLVPAARATKVDPGIKLCNKIHNVLLVQGLIGSLGLIGHNVDVYNQLIARLGGSNGYVLPGLKLNEFDVDTTYSLSLGDIVLVNVTQVSDLIDGITKGMGKMSNQDKARFAQGMKSIGAGGVGQLVDNGFKDMICGVEQFIPIDFLNIAGCKSNATSSAAASSGAASSSGSTQLKQTSSAASSKPQAAPTGGQASQKPSSASVPQQSKPQAQNQGGNAKSDGGNNGKQSAAQASKPSSSQGGGFLGGIFST